VITRVVLLLVVLVVLGGCRRAHPAAPSAPVAPVAAPEPPPAPAPEFVIVLSEDGLRPDVLDEKLTPNHVAFIKEGASAVLARTIRESDTLPSHASMLSGYEAKDHRLWWNSFKEKMGYIHVPTIFSIAKQHGLSTAMFIGKPKLRHIALPGSVDHLERPGYLCGAVSRRAAEYFVKNKPNLMFVHFSDPDEFGHAKGWMSSAYLQGAANSDKCLGTLLGALEKSGLASRTLVIVTADHGGHAKVHSGSHLEVDREIPWIVRGPGIRPGSRVAQPIVTVDTAATVLTALKLPLPPHIAGVPISD
jgi:arylsulfatase A-like enzyme